MVAWSCGRHGYVYGWGDLDRVWINAWCAGKFDICPLGDIYPSDGVNTWYKDRRAALRSCFETSKSHSIMTQVARASKSATPAESIPCITPTLKRHVNII